MNNKKTDKYILSCLKKDFDKTLEKWSPNNKKIKTDKQRLLSFKRFAEESDFDQIANLAYLLGRVDVIEETKELNQTK